MGVLEHHLTRSRSVARQSLLLACGILAALVYLIAHDVLAALFYDGYSASSQTVSELTSVGAPTRTAALAVELTSDALLVAFGIGVVQSARGRRSLRVVGACLIGYGAMFPLWLPFPMTARGTAAPGATDLGHVVLGTISIALMLTAIGFGAAAFGRGFRVYSTVTWFAVLVFWVWSGSYGGHIATGQATPWLGVVERVALVSWLGWVLVLAVLLLREARNPVEHPQALHTPTSIG
jgi:hypothetical protein